MAAAGSPVCISVINMKGGVGKTTIAALLSRYAAQSLGRQVLAIDLDPQANLSQALMGEQSYRKFLDDKITLHRRAVCRVSASDIQIRHLQIH